MREWSISRSWSALWTHVGHLCRELVIHPILTLMAGVGLLVLALPVITELSDKLVTFCALGGIALVSAPIFRSTNAIFDFIRGYKDLQLTDQVPQNAADLLRREEIGK